MRTGYNHLTVAAYTSGTTRVPDPVGELARAEGLVFNTGYPGGLYLDASFYVARDVIRSWLLAGAQRVVFRNGLAIVYEGQLDSLERALQQAGEGFYISATGYWGALLMRRRWRKRWADQRLNEDLWAWQTSATGAEKCTLDRTDRIRFTPKAEAWTSGEYAAVRYTMPTGETVKKIDYDYQLQEGAQQWEIAIRNVGTSTDVVSVTASGSAAGQSHTLAAPSQSIEFRYYARANQTPTADGTYFGEFLNFTVYSETSAINLTEIATDIVGEFTDLNSGTGEIGSNTYSLVPFVADDWETAADILMQAAAFGDSSFNRWAIGVRHSETVASPDGKSVLFVEQYPALTDYDYAVRLDEPNLVAPFSADQDFTDLWNWIVVRWTDDQGFTQYTTPDDDANLKDTTSITAYGQRDYVLDCGHSTQTVATNNGRRYLAARKDPQWRVDAPITVTGYIRAKSGNRVPVSEIRAGQRIKIENYLSDLSGTGLTLLITRTTYVDTTETCAIGIGLPDELIQERLAAAGAAFSELPPPASETQTVRPEKKNWREKLGYSKEEWQAMTPAERWRIIKNRIRKRK